MANDFNEYFRAVHGADPYPWQTRLANGVLESERWPSVIGMPTGSGKSAVLDIALYALAMKPSAFPRRVAFVVDRRIVVDQACERAERIAAALSEAKDGDAPALLDVRDRLMALSGKDGTPLETASLRGGKPMVDDEWTRYPDQPAAIVSTVDMFGSRLLFRGYGASAAMRPIHAALTGNDCLVILDEVQISRAFEFTLGEVIRVQDRQANRLPRRFMVTRMSATPGTDTDAFRPSPEDHADARLRPILEKRALLRLESASARDAIHKKVVAIVRAVEKKGEVGRLGIIVNRVRSARAIADALRDAFKEKPVQVMAASGRMRPLDRARAAARMAELFPPDRIPAPPTADDPLRVLVSTQSVEVGADISFDALITECAPSDSLRQRFGRLARRGLNPDPAPMWIVGQGRAGDDPVYGASVDATWKALKEAVGKEKERTIDQSFFAELGEDKNKETRAPKREAPLIMDAHMDVWAQTRPEPPAQPELDFHLHGMGDSQNPEVTVIWRDDRDSAAFGFAPPRSVEGLRIPITAARQWLNREADDEVEVSDAYMRGRTRDRLVRNNGVLLIRKSGEREFKAWRETNRVLSPGDAIVVSPRLGGLSEDGVWDKNSVLAADDLGGEAQALAGKGLTLRLNPNALSQWWTMKESPTGKGWILPRPNPDAESDDKEDEREEVRRWMASWIDADMAEPADGEPAFRDANGAARRMESAMSEMLDGDFVLERIRDASRRGCYLLRLPAKRVEGREMDGSDELGSMTGTGIALSAHMDGVGERAAESAERLGFPPEIVADLRLAGRLHDAGKAEPRAQEVLAGGDPVRAVIGEEPLAKSVRGVISGRLPTAHDALGAAMVERCGSLLAQANDPDLVIHLIASHHGYARPLARPLADADPREVAYEMGGHKLSVNSGVVNSPDFAAQTAERFRRLSRRYGHYGLAWLEAILRLADHRQSESEDKSHGDRD